MNTPISHQSAGKVHILMTKVYQNHKNATCIELEPGDAVIWHGRTCHYSRGITNQLDVHITNFRPESMVK